MKTSIYFALSKVFLYAGLFFTFMEIVYGYFFGVWRDYYLGLQHPEMPIFMSKFEETVIFAFLSFAFFLSSIACSLIKPRHEN